MIIRKTQQPSDYPSNSISNAKTTGVTNTYSCDYINGIVESGSNENGNWIKYNDGTMICTKSIGVSFDTYSQDGTMYFYDLTNLNFSQTFTIINSINVNFNSTKTGSYPWVGIYNTTLSSISRVRLFNYYSPSNNSGTLYITVIGKWK